MTIREFIEEQRQLLNELDSMTANRPNPNDVSNSADKLDGLAGALDEMRRDDLPDGSTRLDEVEGDLDMVRDRLEEIASELREAAEEVRGYAF